MHTSAGSSMHRSDLQNDGQIGNWQSLAMLLRGNLRGWAGLLHSASHGTVSLEQSWKEGWSREWHQLVCMRALSMKIHLHKDLASVCLEWAQGPALLHKLSGWLRCRGAAECLWENTNTSPEILTSPSWSILALILLPSWLRIYVEVLCALRTGWVSGLQNCLFLFFISVLHSPHPTCTLIV